MRIFSSFVLAAVTATVQYAQPGPAVGSPIPAFSAPDQHGVERTLASVAGPKGTMVVFFRSADW